MRGHLYQGGKNERPEKKRPRLQSSTRRRKSHRACWRSPKVKVKLLRGARRRKASRDIAHNPTRAATSSGSFRRWHTGTLFFQACRRRTQSRHDARNFAAAARARLVTRGQKCWWRHLRRVCCVGAGVTACASPFPRPCPRRSIGCVLYTHGHPLSISTTPMQMAEWQHTKLKFVAAALTCFPTFIPEDKATRARNGRWIRTFRV